MAHFGRDDSFSAARTVQITGSETNENFTTYTIEMTVGSYTWTVKHRYSEFHELHEKLVSGHKVDKGLLPPKKLFGNQTESFVKKRQQDLQLYLQTILNLLALHPPPPLTTFLHFHCYEIHGITQTMAEDLYNRGELLLHSDQVYQMTPLQLHSLTERLKLPEPTCDSGDVRKDLGHILDFITRTRHLQVVGTSEWVGTSTINMNLLPFDLSLFKSLHTLEVENCRFDMVQGLDTIKQTLHHLKVYHTASTVKEVVLQDVPQWRGEDGSQLVGGWDHVTHVDFSHNFIKHIDSSVEILWRVEHLDLSHNQLEGVQHLQWLSHMTHLNLAHNRLRMLDALHTKLGNLKCLLLQGNRIETLLGFSKLFSLEMLDVSDNNIAKVEDVKPVCQLPCMESLRLTENTVTLTVDYRTRILEMFGDRVGEVCLDGEKASQKEKDTVAVRLALQKARDARPRHPTPRKNSSPASLCEMRGGRGGTPPPPTRHSPLTPCGATISSCSAISQGSRADHSQVSTSAPYHSLLRQWSQPNMQHTSPIFTPGRSSPAQTCSGQGGRGEGADLPTPIPEAHPFDPTSDPMPSPTPPTRQEYSVCDLPSQSCQQFLTWLHTHLSADPPSTPALTAHPRLLSTTSDPTTPTRHTPSSSNPMTPAVTPGEGQGHQSGGVVAMMWCYSQFFSSPTTILPCCAILTPSSLLLQRLGCGDERGRGGERSFPSWPDLRVCHALPLSSVQQVVVGPGYSFLRLEEAFVGRGGLLTLFSLHAACMQQFAESLQDCCTLLDPANPVDVLDLLGQSDLLTDLRHREKRAGGLVSDYLTFTLLVRVRAGKEGGWGVLVMTEVVVYVVDVDCVTWPPPTFQSGQDGAMQVKILEELAINNVTHLSLHCPHPPEEGGGPPRVDFTPLPLTLHGHTPQGPRQVTVLFRAEDARQVFMDRLSSVRVKLGQGPPLTQGCEDGADLADCSFQSCRSHCSSGVGSGNNPMSATFGEGPTQLSASPSLRDHNQFSSCSQDPDCTQSPKDPAQCPEDPAQCPEDPDSAQCPEDPAQCPEDPAQCPEDPDSAQCPEVSGDSDLSADLTASRERSGGQSDVHPEVSAEAPVHDPHAMSDGQCNEGEGHAGHDGNLAQCHDEPSEQRCQHEAADGVQGARSSEERFTKMGNSSENSEEGSRKVEDISGNADKCSRKTEDSSGKPGEHLINSLPPEKNEVWSGDGDSSAGDCYGDHPKDRDLHDVNWKENDASGCAGVEQDRGEH